MVFFSLLLSLLLAATTLGSPVSRRVRFPPIPVTPRGLLCGLPIPIVQKLLCPKHGAGDDPIVNTPLGQAHGVIDTANAARFAVKYASASRWQPPAVATSWQLPNGNTDPLALPKACPQDDFDDSAMTEDCLSMLIYVPPNLQPNANVPTLLWIHGGSFTEGSATFPGLDGSNLAVATNSIVAVIQYRLGVLGLFAPNGNNNLALQDVITGLKFLQRVVPSFGGNAGKITVAGQSSGANIIRALLATPSASSLFVSGILQSDPMNYGFLSPAGKGTLQDFFNSQLPCSASDASCLNNLSTQAILDAQSTLNSNAPYVEASAGIGEPLRLFKDGSLITTTLDDQSPFPSVTKPLLITNVKNEAGTSIFGQAFPAALDGQFYDMVVNGTFGTDTPAVLNSPWYSIPAAEQDNEDFDTRPTLEILGTDQMWRCPTWTFARNWVAHGGNAYVGTYVVGSSYPGNSAAAFCTQPGVICHQDDIEIVFGTAPNPTSQQSALISEMQARYKAFLQTGNPNVPARAQWAKATTSDVNSLVLGGSGEYAAGGCDPSFFGVAVKYDYQKFGI